MEIELEKIIKLITAEVVKELRKQGVQVTAAHGQSGNSSLQNKSEKIDMSKYKTPVLTESQLKKLHELTGEIIIPKKTVITPKAKEIIKQKNLLINFE